MNGQEAYRKRTRAKRRARRRRAIILRGLVFSLLVLGIIIGSIAIFGRSKVVSELEWEAGQGLPQLSDFLTKGNQDAAFVTDLSSVVDINTVSDYQIVISISGKEYTSILHIVDTTAPVVSVRDATVYIGGDVQPEAFIESIDDATKTTVMFDQLPDFTVAGLKEVNLTVTDEGGNAVSVSAKATVVEDTEPPVIEGVEELSVVAGGSVSYKKNVTVTDNYDENVTLTVDNSAVNLNQTGDYPIIYIAEDSAGNRTEEATVLHVTTPTVETATEDIVNAKADEILAEILTAGMSQYDQAKAIFNWVHDQIAYYDGTPKTNWVQGAYRGLFERKGDCFVYASTSKVMLTRAGITNMDIEKIPSTTHHYWNLIDIGEGWYHFDATRRKDGTIIFYWKDENLIAYSNSHNLSHNYDASQYPAIE